MSGKIQKKQVGKALAAVLALAFFLHPLVPSCVAQEGSAVPVSLKNPQELEAWLSKNITYQMKIPDSPQTVEETLQFRTGDRDDFAALASAALAQMGISGKVVVIKLKGHGIKHAICLWQDASGTYNFFTNNTLVYTGEKTMEAAIKRGFPSCEKSWVQEADSRLPPAARSF